MKSLSLSAASLTAVLLIAAAAPAEAPRPETYVKSYYVGDLLGVPRGKRLGPVEPAIDFSPMIKLITSTIARDSWLSSDPNARVKPVGTIEPFFLAHSLVIRQTNATHHDIEILLRRVRLLPAFQGQEQK